MTTDYCALPEELTVSRNTIAKCRPMNHKIDSGDEESTPLRMHHLERFRHVGPLDHRDYRSKTWAQISLYLSFTTSSISTLKKCTRVCTYFKDILKHNTFDIRLFRCRNRYGKHPGLSRRILVHPVFRCMRYRIGDPSDRAVIPKPLPENYDQSSSYSMRKFWFSKAGAEERPLWQTEVAKESATNPPLSRIYLQIHDDWYIREIIDVRGKYGKSVTVADVFDAASISKHYFPCRRGCASSVGKCICGCCRHQEIGLRPVTLNYKKGEVVSLVVCEMDFTRENLSPRLHLLSRAMGQAMQMRENNLGHLLDRSLYWPITPDTTNQRHGEKGIRWSNGWNRDIVKEDEDLDVCKTFPFPTEAMPQGRFHGTSTVHVRHDSYFPGQSQFLNNIPWQKSGASFPNNKIISSRNL